MTIPAADQPDDDTRRQAVRALEESFSELAAEFRRYYVRAAEVASPGMLPGTFKLLTVVARLGPITLSALAERLTADKGMLSRQVSELESLGMIERTSDPDDGRVRLIAATEFGRERLTASRSPYETILHEVLREWPLAEIDRLTSLVHALAVGAVPDTIDAGTS